MSILYCRTAYNRFFALRFLHHWHRKISIAIKLIAKIDTVIQMRL